MSRKSQVEREEAHIISWNNERNEEERHLVWTDSDPVSGEPIRRELTLTHRDGYWSATLREYDRESIEFYESYQGALARVQFNPARNLTRDNHTEL
jgi:hypothetical protein